MNIISLQEKVAKTACMSACKHIAASLKDFLLDNNVTQMTLPALMQFSLDLVQCEGELKLKGKQLCHFHFASFLSGDQHSASKLFAVRVNLNLEVYSY